MVPFHRLGCIAVLVPIYLNSYLCTVPHPTYLRMGIEPYSTYSLKLFLGQYLNYFEFFCPGIPSLGHAVPQGGCEGYHRR
jgi:hypothetical protein